MFSSVNPNPISTFRSYENKCKNHRNAIDINHMKNIIKKTLIWYLSYVIVFNDMIRRNLLPKYISEVYNSVYSHRITYVVNEAGRNIDKYFNLLTQLNDLDAKYLCVNIFRGMNKDVVHPLDKIYKEINFNIIELVRYLMNMIRAGRNVNLIEQIFQHIPKLQNVRNRLSQGPRSSRISHDRNTVETPRWTSQRSLPQSRQFSPIAQHRNITSEPSQMTNGAHFGNISEVEPEIDLSCEQYTGRPDVCNAQQECKFDDEEQSCRQIRLLENPVRYGKWFFGFRQ